MSPRVLLLEDDPDICLVSVEVLAAAGLDVEEVSSVAQALEACDTRTPDLALVDLALPEGSGWDFVRAIRSDARFRDLRIAIYSVYHDEPEQVRQAERLRVDAMLGKPGDPADLIDRVRRLLEH